MKKRTAVKILRRIDEGLGDYTREQEATALRRLRGDWDNLSVRSAIRRKTSRVVARRLEVGEPAFPVNVIALDEVGKMFGGASGHGDSGIIEEMALDTVESLPDGDMRDGLEKFLNEEPKPVFAVHEMLDELKLTQLRKLGSHNKVKGAARMKTADIRHELEALGADLKIPEGFLNG
jgi:hypothetical protein